MVVDVLSADVIKDNLSHIRGVDIVEGKVQSINNLLDIFTFLYEYVIKQIESDVPTDTEGNYVLYPYSFFLWSIIISLFSLLWECSCSSLLFSCFKKKKCCSDL